MSSSYTPYTSGIALKNVTLELHTITTGYVAVIRANGFVWRGEGDTPGRALFALRNDVNDTPRGAAKKPTNRYRTSTSLGFIAFRSR
jgi:hypothetical protein